MSTPCADGIPEPAIKTTTEIGDLDATDELRITGDGAATTVLDAQSVDRVLHVARGVVVSVAGDDTRYVNRPVARPATGPKSRGDPALLPNRVHR